MGRRDEEQKVWRDHSNSMQLTTQEQQAEASSEDQRASQLRWGLKERKQEDWMGWMRKQAPTPKKPCLSERAGLERRWIDR
jgi:hypothetical protein